VRDEVHSTVLLGYGVHDLGGVIDGRVIDDDHLERVRAHLSGLNRPADHFRDVA